MERIKKTKIEHLWIDPEKRLLFMSDLHGDLRLFQKALKQVGFCSDDILFILGDMIEKGDDDDNLAMLEYMIEFSKQDNVYLLAGNCDEIFRFILPPVDEKKFLYYALTRKHSVINDLAKRMQISLSKEMDINAFVSKIEKEYLSFYQFTDSLPDVLFLNEKMVLVHGGIADINRIPEKAIEVLKYDRFLETAPPQPLLMMVGHYPTRNYRSDVFNVDPIFDFRKRIIAIDGGNNVVKGGQINIVILDCLNGMNFSFQAVDHYPKYILKEDVYHAQDNRNTNICFGQNEVEILKRDLDFVSIRPLGLKDEMWVHHSFIYTYNGKNYCFDGTNYFMNLKKGDKISIVKLAEPYCLVKQNGTIGLIESTYIHEDELLVD